MKMVKPKYRRTMSFPVEIKVPLRIVIATGCDRKISVTDADQALPAPLVDWLANNAQSPLKAHVEGADGQLEGAWIAGTPGPELINVPDGAKLVLNEDAIENIAEAGAKLYEVLTQSHATTATSGVKASVATDGKARSDSGPSAKPAQKQPAAQAKTQSKQPPARKR